MSRVEEEVANDFEEEEEEKLAVDQYFEDININETLSLHDLLFDYVSKTNICKLFYELFKELL